jgi:3-oxoacyl-[acyl-carrier protein] reductase
VRNTQQFRWIWSSTPQEVAKTLVSELPKGSVEIFVGWQSKIAALLNRFVPQLMEKIVFLCSPLVEFPGIGGYRFSLSQEG